MQKMINPKKILVEVLHRIKVNRQEKAKEIIQKQMVASSKTMKIPKIKTILI